MDLIREQISWELRSNGSHSMWWVNRNFDSTSVSESFSISAYLKHLLFTQAKIHKFWFPTSQLTQNPKPSNEKNNHINIKIIKANSSIVSHTPGFLSILSGRPNSKTKTGALALGLGKKKKFLVIRTSKFKPQFSKLSLSNVQNFQALFYVWFRSVLFVMLSFLSLISASIFHFAF